MSVKQLQFVSILLPFPQSFCNSVIFQVWLWSSYSGVVWFLQIYQVQVQRFRAFWFEFKCSVFLGCLWIYALLRPPFSWINTKEYCKGSIKIHNFLLLFNGLIAFQLPGALTKISEWINTRRSYSLGQDSPCRCVMSLCESLGFYDLAFTARQCGRMCTEGQEFGFRFLYL